jgi:Skp family chaperone for outer membrane proteins
MLRHRLLAVAALATAIAASPVSFTPAAASPAPDVIVVNVNKILAASKSASSLRSQTEAAQKGLSADLSQREKELLAAKDDLTKQRQVLADDAFNEKVKAYQKRVDDYQAYANSKKQGLTKGAEAAEQQIYQALREVVKDLAKEHHATLALADNAVLYSDPEYDVSDEVAKRLDVKLPDVKLVTSAPVAAAAPKK